MASVQLDQVRKVYDNGQVAVQGASFEVADGELMVLVGPSGCGKSTLLRMIAGLEEISGGTLKIGQRVVNEVAPKDRDIAMVFQSYALYPHMTVAENLAFGLKLRKHDKATIDARIKAAAETLGLTSMLDKLPKAMSGGQRQRVALGRALVREPAVFLLDEPLSNLDAKLREEARAFLRELIIRLGLSALMVTHDQSEAMAISDRILLLNNGKIEQQGTPQEMYGSPSTLFTAEFMGSNNRLEGKVTEVRDGRARIEGRGWALWGKAGEGVTQGQDGTAVIRVEQVRLADDPDGNHLDMPLLTSMYLGDRWEYLFRTPDADPANTLALRAYGPEGREPGPCRLALPASKVWVFPRKTA